MPCRCPPWASAWMTTLSVLQSGCALAWCTTMRTPSLSALRDVVDHTGTHGLRCRYSKGRHPRHATINEVIKRSLGSANIPCHLELTGLYRSDGKQPDGMSIIPWKRGKVLVWDATCPDTLAPSYITLASREAGAVAEGPRKRSVLSILIWRKATILCLWLWNYGSV